MIATQASGATEISANADSDHQGVTDELRDTIETGNSCVSVKVNVKAKKKSFHPKIRQNIPATTNPGTELGRTTRKKAPIGLQPSVIAISSSSFGIPEKKSVMTQTAMGSSNATYTNTRPKIESSAPSSFSIKKNGIARTMGGIIRCDIKKNVMSEFVILLK